jgi:hypothetical protein
MLAYDRLSPPGRFLDARLICDLGLPVTVDGCSDRYPIQSPSRVALGSIHSVDTRCTPSSLRLPSCRAIGIDRCATLRARTVRR